MNSAVDAPYEATGHNAAKKGVDDPFVGLSDAPSAISGEGEGSEGGQFTDKDQSVSLGGQQRRRQAHQRRHHRHQNRVQRE